MCLAKVINARQGQEQAKNHTLRTMSRCLHATEPVGNRLGLTMIRQVLSKPDGGRKITLVVPFTEWFFFEPKKYI